MAKAGKTQKKKSGNKHASNMRRIERKHNHNVARMAGTRVAEAGRCGSSFCSAMTGCNPWKTIS